MILLFCIFWKFLTLIWVFANYDSLILLGKLTNMKFTPSLNVTRSTKPLIEIIKMTVIFLIGSLQWSPTKIIHIYKQLTVRWRVFYRVHDNLMTWSQITIYVSISLKVLVAFHQLWPAINKIVNLLWVFLLHSQCYLVTIMSVNENGNKKHTLIYLLP